MSHTKERITNVGKRNNQMINSNKLTEKEINERLTKLGFGDYLNGNKWIYQYDSNFRENKPFYSYYFEIKIKFNRNFPPYKISWDIVYQYSRYGTFRDSNRHFLDEYYLSSIIKKYPLLINQRIIDFSCKFPIKSASDTLDLDDVETMLFELRDIVQFLNQKDIEQYRIVTDTDFCKKIIIRGE